MKVLLNNKMAEVPEGLTAKIYRRGSVVYRVTSKDAVIKLVAEILFRLRGVKGSIACLGNRKIVHMLGMSEGYFDALTSNWVSLLLSELGIVTQSYATRKRKCLVIDLKNPIMNEIRNAKSVDEVVEIVKSHLR